ncbi:hypothetical protein Tco_0087087 [Tanacetum coccineum]
MFRRLYLSRIFRILRDLIIKCFVKKLHIKKRRFFKCFKIFALTLASRKRFVFYAKILLPSRLGFASWNRKCCFELAKIPLNENCSAMLLKKLPEKLGDPGKFLIPCNFSIMDVCHALADLVQRSIYLLPLSFGKRLSLTRSYPHADEFKLANRSITNPKGPTRRRLCQSGKVTFPSDFVVVDLKLILEYLS